MRDYLGAGPDAPFYMKFLAGAITGGVGSVVGMFLLLLNFFVPFVSSSILNIIRTINYCG